MTDWVTCEVKGLSELQSKLEGMQKKAAKDTIRAALRAGANEVVTEAETKAPRESGFTAEHFATRTKMSRDDLAGTALVGATNKEIRPLDVEERTGARHGKTGGLKRTAAFILRQLEFGSHKKPFFTAAFESAKNRALERIIEVLKNRLGL